MMGVGGFALREHNLVVGQRKTGERAGNRKGGVGFTTPVSCTIIKRIK